VPLPFVEASPLLKPIRDRALFNLSKSDMPLPLPPPALTDPLSPAVISDHIASALSTNEPKFIEQYAFLSDKTSETDSLILTACGCLRYLRGCDDKGLIFLQKAVDEHSDHEICWLALLFVFIQTLEFESGLIAFKNAQRRFPRSELLPLFGVSLLLRSGAVQLAWPLLQQLGAADSTVIHERGVAYFLDGELAEAAECFRAVLRGNPGKALEGAAALNLGHCLRRFGRFEQAVAQYGTALKCGARPSVALAAIGFTFHLSGRIDDAILYYNRSLGVDGGQPFATRMLDIAIAM
jgi:anaphase-promoting complex subunit 6